MKVSDLLLELDLKGAAKKSGLADLYAKAQEKKKNEFEAKYNTGMPVKVKVKVYVKKPSYKQEDPYEYREFTIDNLIDIRHKLDGITLIDMSSVEDDKSKHDGKITWAIKKDGKNLPGGLPEYLHGLPARTKKKAGFGPYDLRREAWTDTPLKAYESKVVEDGDAGVEADLAKPNKTYKKILFKKVAPQMNPYVRKKKVDESPLDPDFEKMMKNTIKDKPSGHVSFMQAFGSDEYNMLHKMGIRFYEKPDYWSSLDKPSSSGHYSPISSSVIEQAEKKIGVPFKIYTQDKIFTGRKSSNPEAKDGYFPQSDANIPKEPVFIVHMRDGSRYLADGTQARSYIRMWAKISD